MRKVFFFLIVFLLVFSAAAEPDLSAMSTDDLVTLRDAISHELAQRNINADDAQVIDVDGLLFSIDSVYVGTSRDDVPAICILFNVCNTSDSSKKLVNDVGCDILQDGMLLEGGPFRSDTYSGPSPANSFMADIAPGIVNMKLCVVGALSGDGDNFTIIMSRRGAHADEDPYCGTFAFLLSDYVI